MYCGPSYTERQLQLSNGNSTTPLSSETPPPNEQYTNKMRALMLWVHDTESVLLSEHAVLADLATMEKQLERFKVTSSTSLVALFS